MLENVSVIFLKAHRVHTHIMGIVVERLFHFGEYDCLKVSFKYLWIPSLDADCTDCFHISAKSITCELLF